jgi:hypothetical protein
MTQTLHRVVIGTGDPPRYGPLRLLQKKEPSKEIRR